MGMPRSARSHDFVQVLNREFVEQGRTFPFVGVNMRGLIYYGHHASLPHSSDTHQRQMLQEAYNMGARVVRVFVPSRHASVDVTIDRLHRLIKLVSQRIPGPLSAADFCQPLRRCRLPHTR